MASVQCGKVLFSVLCFLVSSAISRRPPAPPIGADDVRHLGKAAECQFGKSIRELGTTWFADLGPPFGIMYCIKCECIPIHKKKRIVGKVFCRNIKHECPEPKCEEPVLSPGRCCKACPGDGIDVDLVQDAVQPMPEEDDKNYKYYASVLAGDKQSATARFSFTKKSLHYSLYVTSRPQLVQFLDRQGNIIEEQEVGFGTLYENATNKLCGVWRRLPRDYRRLLREEALSISLVWPTMVITGHVLRYSELATEEQSALLIGEKPGSAGTAIVSVSTATPSVHLLLIFTGLFTGDDTNNAPVSVRLHSPDGKDIIHETIKVEKASPELNKITTSTPVSIHDLRLLVRSKLHLTVTAKSSQISITGIVRPRVSCELFQTVLTGERSCGLMTAFLDHKGDFIYQSTLIGVPSKSLITLDILTELLTESGERKLEEIPADGNKLEKTSPRLVEGLYAGQLQVNVAEMSGKMQGRSAAPPRSSLNPLLMKPSLGVLGSLAAVIWIAVDSQCSLYYEAEITENREYCVWLNHVPIAAPGAPVTLRQIDCGHGFRFEGSLLGLPPSEIQILDSGVVTIELRDNVTDNVLMSALWEHKDIPKSCLPETASSDPSYRSDGSGFVITTASCYHGGMFHNDGEQWRDPSDTCTVCSCSLGSLSCQTQCINKTGVVEQEGTLRGCQMAGQFFPAGSTWHPYLPPIGFDTCTICSCDASSLKVSCPRTVCPPLPCDERVAVKIDKKSCCKVCPSGQSEEEFGNKSFEDDESKADTVGSGECEYPLGGPFKNGQEWHPRLYSGGEIKCVICKCLEGNVRCERKRCNNKTACQDECCTAQCKRRRRYARRKHLIPNANA
nr:dorsal-ventral patterning protein Sog isoform X1 [Halyomorpha halys]